MPSHAYVRYKDNNSYSIVPIADVKCFHSEHNADFTARTYFVKWTDADGESDYYAARILVLGDSEEDIQMKLKNGRLRVQKCIESSTSDDEPDEVEKEDKKKRKVPKNDLLEMIEKKKRKIAEATRNEEFQRLQVKLERARKELKNKDDMIASLKSTIEKQEGRVQKLTTLNEGLQETIISMKSVGAAVTLKEHVTPPQPQQYATAATGAVCAEPRTQSPPSSPRATDPCNVMAEGSLGNKIDLGNGLLIPRNLWKSIHSRSKDSLFVRDLLVAVWDLAVLLRKSLEGKHCPRYPGRERKEPLTPWKVAVLKDCFKEHLRSQGLPEALLSGCMKSFNRYASEKIADIEKTAKRSEEKAKE